MRAITTFLVAAVVSWPAGAYDAQGILNELASVLASIQPGRGIACYAEGADLTPVLRGTPANQIRAVLGEPRRCYSGARAPCIESSDWYYPFYDTDSAAGPGLVLLIQFDSGRRVSRIVWSHD